MPQLTPVQPAPHVKSLAVTIGTCIDLFSVNVHALTPVEVLQALEWVRHNYTEAIITAGIAKGWKPGGG